MEKHKYTLEEFEKMVKETCEEIFVDKRKQIKKDFSKLKQSMKVLDSEVTFNKEEWNVFELEWNK